MTKMTSKECWWQTDFGIHFSVDPKPWITKLGPLLYPQAIGCAHDREQLCSPIFPKHFHLADPHFLRESRSKIVSVVGEKDIALTTAEFVQRFVVGGNTLCSEI